MKTIIRAIAVAVSLAVPASLFAQAATSGTSSAEYSGTTQAASSTNEVAQATLARLEAAKLEDKLMSLDTVLPGSGAGPVLVVPAGEMSVEALAAANEDMNVMSRILASSLKPSGASLLGNNWFTGDVFSTGWAFGSATPNIQNLYLQGYGVLFAMKVGFPLSPGPDVNEAEEPPAKTGDDQVWQDARRQLYEPQAERGRRGTAGQEKYSAERVENLKTATVTALKHAANIRGLQPTDSVVVTLIGPGGPTSILRMQTIQGTDDVVVVDKTHKAVMYKGGLPDDLKQSAPTVLTIRAKVADVAAFAKDDLDLDQFRQKVLILSNPYLGGSSGSTYRTSVVVPSRAPTPKPQPQSLSK
jgi:hypothetical protein